MYTNFNKGDLLIGVSKVVVKDIPGLEGILSVVAGSQAEAEKATRSDDSTKVTSNMMFT